MEPNRREFIKQCAFQKFCNTVLHNEACDAHKELHRHKAKEVRNCREIICIFLESMLIYVMNEFSDSGGHFHGT